ncbi:olfactory receptor 2AT4-like [Bufo bufo]|uniref:olfactory receptor 2AT4-like n=1 Tax=Bufo bufo TaxID=8384 RepID=UPI001ABDF584|nr:olfactory receptor 2AT4-like [Bufo bufo]
MANYSQNVYFELIGFVGVPEKYNLVLSFMMFTVYSTALIANGTVIVLILVSRHLHQPMYIFIANLAFSDLLFDTVTLPKFIAKYWFGAGSMSFSQCFLQLFFVHCLGSLDSFILVLMAGDRYVAICYPLRYSSIITHRVTIASCSLSWLLAVISALVTPVLIGQLPFPGQTKIFSCFCSSSALLRSAIGDVTQVRQTLLIVALCVLLIPLVVILLSYVIIIITIHCSSVSSNWQKMFYTCTTHLLVLNIYYIPRVFVYIANFAKLILQPDINVLILCIYSYLPHIANPIIYCLRTVEIKNTIVNLFRRRIGLTA